MDQLQIRRQRHLDAHLHPPPGSSAGRQHQRRRDHRPLRPHRRSLRGNVQLFATSYVINDLDPTFLYGITDTLAFTTASQAASETFTQLAAAPSDSNFKGVSFTPTAPPPAATPANLIFAHALTNTGSGFSDTITISNTGGTSATTVTLTSVKLGSTLGSPLPASVGTVSAGGTGSAVITFPASAGTSGSASTVSVSGTYDGGTFTSTTRVRLP